MPKAEERFFKNAQTWKQISTNVPPEMLKVLKSRVTKERTMSHLLRELIAESALMRYGHLPQPSWCVELTENVAALREEITAERQVRADVETALLELRNEIAELRKEAIPQPEPTLTLRQARQLEQKRLVAIWEESQGTETNEPSDNQPVKEKPVYWPIINRLTEMLGVTRKTA